MLKGTKGKLLFLRIKITTIIIGGRLEDNKEEYEEREN